MEKALQDGSQPQPFQACAQLGIAAWCKVDNAEIFREVHLGFLLMPKEVLSCTGVSSPHGCTVEDCMRRCREGVGVNGPDTRLD